MLCEIIATQLGSGAFPPIIERVDVRVAADGVCQQLLTPLWRSLTSLGKEVDAVVLYQDDAAFVASASASTGRRSTPLKRSDMDGISCVE